jgi:hypothetical protein
VNRYQVFAGIVEVVLWSQTGHAPNQNRLPT